MSEGVTPTNLRDHGNVVSKTRFNIQNSLTRAKVHNSVHMRSPPAKPTQVVSVGPSSFVRKRPCLCTPAHKQVEQSKAAEFGTHIPTRTTRPQTNERMDANTQVQIE